MRRIAVAAVVAGALLFAGPAAYAAAAPAPSGGHEVASGQQVGPFHPVEECQKVRLAYIKKGYTVTSGCYLSGWAYYFNVGKGPAGH